MRITVDPEHIQPIIGSVPVGTCFQILGGGHFYLKLESGRVANMNNGALTAVAELGHDVQVIEYKEVVFKR